MHGVLYIVNREYFCDVPGTAGIGNNKGQKNKFFSWLKRTLKDMYISQMYVIYGQNGDKMPKN